jgi:glucokinase
VTAKEKLRTAGTTLLSEGPPPLTAETIYTAAVRGDQLAREVFTETGRWLGIACANLINFLNPEMIIVSGGVMASGELLLSHARDFVRQDAFPPSLEDCRIVQSKLWPDGGLIGAALLAREAQAR